MYVLYFELVVFLFVLGMTYLATVSSQVFGPLTIDLRNCTHLSIKTNINPNVEGFQFSWVAIIFNGTFNRTVRSILSNVFIY